MGRKSRFTIEDKLNAVLDYKNGKRGVTQKWASDVTEFRVANKLYLSAIIDLYDRSIVSYVVGNRNNNKLIFDDKAIELNQKLRKCITQLGVFNTQVRCFRQN